MKKKIQLKPLKIKEELKNDLPLFYHYIRYNKLKPGDPLADTEFSGQTQSLIFFARPERPVSKILDVNQLM